MLGLIIKDEKTVARLLATGFGPIFTSRLKSHKVNETSSAHILALVSNKLSIVCQHCNKGFTHDSSWSLHHCHACTQIIDARHTGCNFREAFNNSLIRNKFMFGTGH